MQGYLGETPVDISETEYASYTEKDWVKDFISAYGQIDGGHHKLWVLDQVMQILHGTKVEISRAKWENGHVEDRVRLDEPSPQYLDWVKEYEQDGEYEWDQGIAP